MMRSLLLLISIFICSGLYPSDTTGILRGRVYDANTLEPLAGANVIIGKNRGTITDPRGIYFIKIPSGNIDVLIKYIGYKPFETKVLLPSNDTIDLNIGLNREINQIDQIVVSASRTEQKISESTVSMSVIRPDILEKNHITNAGDLINKTSGIEILDGQASIRGGSGFSYGAGSRVLALIDGLPVVAADAGNIRWQFLPLENISQVEIIKGAASVLYGSSALNGIINFRTADAGARPVTKFYAESGIYDKPKLQERIWWDRPRIFTAASFSHLQKAGNTDFGIGGNFFSDNGYRRLNEEKLGRVNLHIKHFNQKINGLNYGLNLNAGYTEKTDFLLWENAGKGALRQDSSTAIELHGTYATIDPFVSYKKSEIFRQDLRIRLQSSQNKFPEKTQNNSDALSFYAEYAGWLKPANFMNLNFGLSENFSHIASNFYGNHQGINVAGLVQADLVIYKNLRAVAGVRLEYNSLDGLSDKIVPVFRAGLNYKAANYTFLRASFGQGYRYPSIAEKHASTTLGAVKIYPNPFIQAESGWNSELGIKQGLQFGNTTGQADVAVFYTQNSDLIEFIFGLYPDHKTGLFDYGFTATNVEQSRVYGIELEFALSHPFGELNLTGSGGYVYMYPVEFNAITLKNTDVFLKYRRKHAGKISLNSEWKNYELGFDFFAKSKILNIDDVFLNELTRETILPGFYDYWTGNNTGYLLIDTNLAYRVTRKLQLSLVVKNLTNKEYMGRPGDIRPQRSFSVRLSGNF